MQTDMDIAQVAAYLARGGDVVAEVLGNVLAAIADGDADERTRMLDAARQTIIEWHILRARVLPRGPGGADALARRTEHRLPAGQTMGRRQGDT